MTKRDTRLGTADKFTLPPQLASTWLQFQQQTAANPRLRWMLWGIAYIFIIYFALSLGEWRASHGQNIAQLQRTSLKLDQLHTQTEWPERQAAELAAAATLRAKLWHAKSASLAEADLQNYLRQLMLEQQADGLRLRLAPTETLELGGETLLKVSADVTGVVGVNKIDTLMRAIAANPQVLLVERFGYSPQRAGQINMLVTGYFLTTDDEAVNAKP